MKLAYSAVLSLLIVGGLACLTGCRRAPPPLYSPDGSMMLVTSIERSRRDPASYLCVVFEIRSTNGATLHRENTRASDTMRWSMSWRGNLKVRLTSGDIGDYEWHKNPDGTWTKSEPDLNKPPNAN
jgi:hypothetical protein